MKHTYKKVLSVILAIGLLSAFATTAFAAPAEQEGSAVITSDSKYYLTAEDITSGDCFTKEEIAAATEDGSVILGGMNAPVSEIANASASTRAITGQVWCRTYATYNANDGVTVSVELYVPWYYFANPKFTSMTGTVTVRLNDQNTSKAFGKYTSESKTIDTSVTTGAKAGSLTKGTVTVSGIATGTNIVAGGGYFSSNYEIQIP